MNAKPPQIDIVFAIIGNCQGLQVPNVVKYIASIVFHPNIPWERMSVPHPNQIMVYIPLKRY